MKNYEQLAEKNQQDLRALSEKELLNVDGGVTGRKVDTNGDGKPDKIVGCTDGIFIGKPRKPFGRPRPYYPFGGI